MHHTTMGIARYGRLAVGSLLLAACGGGGVSSSTSNSGTSGTPAGNSGSPVITVSASDASPATSAPSGVQFISSSTGFLNTQYVCPANAAAHLNPPISWTAGPTSSTAYYVIIIDDESQITVDPGASVHWIVRTSFNFTSLAANLTSLTSGLNVSLQGGTAISNLFVPPYYAGGGGGNGDTYTVHVYAMTGAWLPDPTQAAGPGADFSNVSLPGLNSASALAPYFGGTSPGGFETLYAPYISGKGSASGLDLINTGGPC